MGFSKVEGEAGDRAPAGLRSFASTEETGEKAAIEFGELGIIPSREAVLTGMDGAAEFGDASAVLQSDIPASRVQDDALGFRAAPPEAARAAATAAAMCGSAATAMMAAIAAASRAGSEWGCGPPGWPDSGAGTVRPGAPKRAAARKAAPGS